MTIVPLSKKRRLARGESVVSLASQRKKTATCLSKRDSESDLPMANRSISTQTPLPRKKAGCETSKVASAKKEAVLEAGGVILFSSVKNP